jgi:osmoprotectant transport system permease protein
MGEFAAYIGQNIGVIGARLWEHLLLVAGALLIAVPFGLLLGVLASRPLVRRLRSAVLYLLGLGQTIPSLAVLALAVGVLGIGMMPAILALVLYALLPIARNTLAGIESAPAATIDAARGLGLTDRQILTGVELPLAVPFIMSGVRIATVVTVSAAALACLIGGGGLGDLIFSGIALFRPEMMLAGAIPVALLALLADRGLGGLERRLDPLRRGK